MQVVLKLIQRVVFNNFVGGLSILFLIDIKKPPIGGLIGLICALVFRISPWCKGRVAGVGQGLGFTVEPLSVRGMATAQIELVSVGGLGFRL